MLEPQVGGGEAAGGAVFDVGCGSADLGGLAGGVAAVVAHVGNDEGERRCGLLVLEVVDGCPANWSGLPSRPTVKVPSGTTRSSTA